MNGKRKRAPLAGRVANAMVGLLIGRFGVNLQGAELLHVRGRMTGRIRSVPVNPVVVRGARYLVAPRGETAWVRNIRVAGEATLQHGRRREHIRVEEVPDDAKVPILREYLRRWYWQVGRLFGVPKHADDATLQAIAGRHPVFRIVPSSVRAAGDPHGPVMSM